MEKVRIGVIGGSGVYDMAQLTDVREVRLDTPFGAPSDAYVVGQIGGQPVAFLPRHGRGHRISPTQLNSQANIYGFKMLGVEYLISISACGSLQPQYKPGDIVVPDQLFDRTRLRPLSFFDDPSAGTGGLVVHVSVADPFCAYLSGLCADAVAATGHTVHRGGTFVTIEGPRFSTKAESQVFKQSGFAIVGMTAAPEAFLAREAGISYATMAHVTDYDVWHETEAAVTVEMVVRQLLENAEIAKASVVNAVLALRDAPPSPYDDALKDAIITQRGMIPPAVAARLDLLIGKHLC
ncbi:MAG: S-methyl-5'-thioadenosine phosphorylase [Chloroflexi bacterium HGW-Chloroflexi-1]|nr:MAG: S-methyl-5'-thioadenosine phosphorylase [Chloroflexi bacterium HGW-Chloroflexi-1]